MPVDFALLDKLQGNPNPPQVTVDDINNSPAVGMSPAEQDAYNEYQKQYQAAPEALKSSDYFPGMNEPINVGGYSGNIIGSTTLFAPGGALVPFGMMDARDAAVHKAALAKAKDVQDFRAKLKANPPTSKLTGINEDLTNSYFGYIDNEYKKALQKSGGDANKATFLLNQDQNFQKGLNSYHDLKANGDAVFNHLAEVDERIKNGDVVSEEYKEAARKAVSSMDPTSPDFKNFSQNFLRLGAEREFMKTFNEVTKGVVASELAKAGIDESNPDYLRIVESKVKSLGEDQKEAIVQGMNDIYRGSSIYKDVPQRIKKLLNYRIEDKKVSVHNKRVNEGDMEQLNLTDISNESGKLNGIVAGTGTPAKDKDGNIIPTKPGDFNRQGSFTQMDGLTLKKPQPVVIPGGADVTDMTTGRKSTNNAVKEATIGGIYNAYTYNGQIVDDEFMKQEIQTKDGKKIPASRFVTVTPMVTAIFKEKDTNGNEIETTGHVPLEQVKNSLRGRRNENDKVIEEYFKRAKEKTAALKGESKQAASNMITVTLNGKTGEIPESQWSSFKKKYPSATR